MSENSPYDAIIVGAGIGGGAMATVLARSGKRVLVLERTAVHRDRVRGEWIAMWGVEELKRLELYDAFMEAGAHHLTYHMSCHPETPHEVAEAGLLPLSILVPGIPGPLCIGHPRSCDLLDSLAVEAGATLLREVTDITLNVRGPDLQPAGDGGGGTHDVTYTHAGDQHTATARIIIGADGRGSVVRRQAGIELHTDPPHHWFSGLLVEDAHGWPEDRQMIGAEDDVHFLAFPQGNGRIRLYLGYAREQPQRLTGDDAQQRFLDAFRATSIPGGEHLANATPAGPCNSYPNEDAWTDTPYVPGVVLIGDAAGYNDPIIGQGLSITYRDVRMVRDILLEHDDWSDTAIFAPYAEERAERMRRLRFSARLVSELECEFTEEAVARNAHARARQAADPSLLLPIMASLIGPERIPENAFEDATRDRLFA